VTSALESSVRFGYCVPVFANPGAAFFRTPAVTALDPRSAIDVAVEAERLGFDSVWVADHLMHGFDDAIMEGWTTLSVIAGRTSRIRLGTIHLAQPFRAPAIAAKMAATLDVLSSGRLIFFYDCGWQAPEVRAYGLDWPSDDERIARMDEGLDLIETLWTSDTHVDFQGKYFSTSGAVCRPGPKQQPRPPIWLGESRGGVWLDAVVRHADGWNSTPASPAHLQAKLDALRAACKRAGKDMAQLELSLESQVLIAPTEAEVRDIARRITGLPLSKRGEPRSDLIAALESSTERPLSGVVDDWLVGTPESIAEQLRVYIQMGITYFMLWFLDYPSLDGMRLFSQQMFRR
jgi:alkanesulfonate monooxygenase SsuD/methylene tetrahydromethanopterin reductase-like flavin-dependent oxidoreductase (luciferase family)